MSSIGQELPLERLCGQLIVGGFEGDAAAYAKHLAAGRRGGAILFKRNLPAGASAETDVVAASVVTRALRDAAPADLPPFIGVDQEGGRVARLGPPVLQLPPMRVLGELDDLGLVRRAGRALGGELAAIGFNIDFAPVLDVDSNPDNPVIGDRSFGRDPRTVMKNAVAFMQGLQDANVLACGKHFPGHGDTSVDSHFDLPVIAHDRARLEAIELPPFRAASGAGIASLMTAHVVCSSIDPGVPATLSRSICASLLRAEIGFEGVLFSDDLEMSAVASRYDVETAAVEAVWAGCDALLVCKSEEMQERALAALVKKAESDAKFKERCREAFGRCIRVRRLAPPKPIADAGELMRAMGGAAAREVTGQIAAARAQRRLRLS